MRATYQQVEMHEPCFQPAEPFGSATGGLATLSCLLFCDVSDRGKQDGSFAIVLPHDNVLVLPVDSEASNLELVLLLRPACGGLSGVAGGGPPSISPDGRQPAARRKEQAALHSRRRATFVE